MSERNGYPQGTPCWADLTSSDVEGARAFYGALFGWEWEIAAPEYGSYSTGLLRGKKVAAVANRMDESQPVVWTTYLAVDDADKWAAAVPEAGGTVAMAPMDIPGAGRFGIGADPTGAFFGVWQAAEHRGSELVNEPGTIVWNELVTPDLAAAGAFYEATLGLRFEDMEGADASMPAYKLLKVGGRTAGGAMAPMPGMEGLPPHWGIYFEVADADAAVARAQELGARVVMPVTPTPQGPMASFLDPQGGAFSVIASGSTE
jgi:predicted enzyme related to lactoylglutathione lyase